MHRAKTADALLPQIAVEQEADVMIICEQYSRRTSGCWLEDDTATAAFWAPTTCKTQPKSTGKGNCFVWAQFDNITVISCYLTPSDSIGDFETKLNEIEDKMMEIGGHFIVAGDLNARAVDWGMLSTNSRGRKIMDMAARTGLVVANVGNTPTFRRPGCEGTIPDITLVSEKIADKVENWKVLEIYTGSDHQYISYSLKTDGTRIQKSAGNKSSTRKWDVNKLDTTALNAAIDRQLAVVNIHGDARTIVDQVMDIIRHGCNSAMPRVRKPRSHKKAVYWWSETIADLRRNCLRCRRKFTRAKRRGTAEAEREEYKDARKKLRKAIFDSKKKLWEELREDINKNPWGLGYKLVMKKLGAKHALGEIDEDTMRNIVQTLFPTHETRIDEIETESNIGLTEFTMDELQTAARSLKNNKAPGPDGIPAEVIKEIAAQRPDVLLQMYNSCLREGIFPREWKKQRLVLISKGKGDATSPSAYRPLCMLDTAGKLMEKLIKPRLQEAIHASGGLSNRQHGFRAKKSTLGALKDVIDVVEASQRLNQHSRPIVLLATLDVKNAFNSLRWTDVLQALKENFAVPEYLMRMIKDYLRDRVLLYDTSGGPKEYKVTSGAAQGSILGPDLWNASYNEILRIEMPADTFLVGYADDIAAVIKARSTAEAQGKLRQVMIRTRAWLSAHGLELAMHKTELLLLTRRHMPTEIEMRIDNEIMFTQKSIKYLGISLDPKLTYWAQIQYATTKAAQITAQLSRLMANTGGPLSSKRRLLMEASNSILLYGCEIWAETLNVKQRAKTLLAAQRRSALRITSAYRTVSETAVLLIAGMTPIDIYAQERQKIWNIKQNESQLLTVEEVKAETVTLWQSRWSAATNGRWTAKLIPDITIWLNRKSGEVNYYLTQMISGHGYFRKYLCKVGKCDTPYCLYEGTDTVDDAEHTFFECTRWRNDRLELEIEIGHITTDNLVEKMVENDDKWSAVAKYCERLLRAKKVDLDNAANIDVHTGTQIAADD